MNLKEMREVRADAFEALEKIHNACKADGDRQFKEDEKRDFDELAGKIQDLDAKIERQELVDTCQAGKSDDQVEAENRAAHGVKPDAITPELQRQAIAGWCAGRMASKDQVAAADRCGVDIGSPFLSLEQRDLTTGTASLGGNLVATSMVASVDKAMVAFGNVRNASTVVTTQGGGTIDMPTVTDSGNSGAVLAEGSADSETDPAFGKLSLGAFKITSNLVAVSLEMLADPQVDMASLLGDLLGERLARGLNAFYTTGTGSGQPLGVAAAAANSGVTTASNTAITYEELLALEHSVDPAYRVGASWMFNDTIYKQIKEIADSQNRPLWLPAGLQDGAAGRLLGYPIILNQDMASGASAKAVLFGDLKKNICREVGSVTLRRSDEFAFDKYQATFAGFLRADSGLLQTSAVKYATLAS